MERSDGLWHVAKIVHRRFVGPVCEYYVHYEGFNRRLDEWVQRDRIKLDQEGVQSPGGNGMTYGRSKVIEHYNMNTEC